MMNLITFLLGLSSALNQNVISGYQKLSQIENATKAEIIFQQAESYYNKTIKKLALNNEQKALALYDEAATLGHVRAQIRLAEIYLGDISAETVESPNGALAARWLEMAIEYDNTGQAAYMSAKLMLSEVLLSQQLTGWKTDIPPSINKEIFDYYQQSANLGYKDAFFQVAYRYEQGEGTEKNLEKAFEYYKKAADAGDYLSFEKVGRMYQKGIGTKQDFAKAYEYYTKIDEVFADSEEYEPNPTIIFYLGEMYRDGEYVKQNKQKAIEYFTMACEYVDDVENGGACEALKKLKNKSSQ